MPPPRLTITTNVPGTSALTAGLGVPPVRRNELQEIAELLNGKAGVARDTTHRDGIDRVVARNGQNPRTVPHHHVLALA